MLKTIIILVCLKLLSVHIYEYSLQILVFFEHQNLNFFYTYFKNKNPIFFVFKRTLPKCSTYVITPFPFKVDYC